MHFLTSLNWNLVHICKGWKLTHCKFTTWRFTSRQKCLVLCMLSSYPSRNIHLILNFYAGLKYIRAVPSAVLQKMGNRVKFWWCEFRWLAHQSGGAGTLANIQEGLVMADTHLHSMKHQKNVWNLFKVHKKGIKKMPMTLYWCLHC